MDDIITSNIEIYSGITSYIFAEKGGKKSEDNKRTKRSVNAKDFS